MSVKTHSRHETRQLGTVYTRAQVQPSTINAETRTVEVVFATETPVERYDWWDDVRFKEVLVCSNKAVDFTRLKSGGPVLNAHSRSTMSHQIGIVENPRVEGNQCIATLRFSKRPEVEPIWQDVQDGIYRNISVGYDVNEYTVDEHVEGETPTYRATKWTPGEISLVPIPADINSGTRSKETEFKHNVTIIQNSTRNMDENPTTEATTVVPPAQPTAVPPKTTENENGENGNQPKDTGERAAAGLNGKESAEISKIGRSVNIPVEEVEKIQGEAKNMDEARKAIFKILETRQAPINGQHSGTQTGVGKEERDHFRAGARNGLLLRSAQAAGKSLKPEEVQQARQYQSLSLIDLAKECLTRAGIDFKLMDKMEMVGRAITSHTSDFPVLLGGVVHQVLLAAYGTVPDVWRQFCSIGSVSDFRDYSFIRKGSFGRLDKVVEDAEYKYKPIGDGTAEKIAAQTFGNLVNISRKMIINDDLGAFTSIAADLGRAAARSIEIDVFALLALNGGNGPVMGDGKTLFHADHGNLVTGAVPTVLSWDGMRIAMAMQKGPGDPATTDYLDLRPSILLTSTANGSAARLLNTAQYDNDTTGKFMKPNVVAGLFNKIIDTPRISGTQAYAFADPSIADTLKVVFLDGNQTPFLDQQDAFTQDGMIWKIRHDYGMGAVDYRGALRNPGA